MVTGLRSVFSVGVEAGAEERPDHRARHIRRRLGASQQPVQIFGGYRVHVEENQPCGRGSGLGESVRR